MQILFLLFGIFYIALAWRRLELALFFLICFLPTYQIRAHFGFMPTNVLEIMIIVLFVSWLTKAAMNQELPWLNVLSNAKKTKGKYFIAYPFAKEISLILVISFLAVVTSGFSSASLGILKAYFLEPIMFFIVFINIFKLPKNRLYIFWSLALSALMVSAVAIYQKATGQLLPLAWVNSGRVTSVFTYPNALGLYLGPIILLILGYAWSLKNMSWQRYIFIFISALAIISIGLAKSEGALFGLAAAFVIMGILYNNKTRLYTLGCLLIIFLALLGNSSWRANFITKAGLMDLDGQIRRQQWTETWQMLQHGYFITGAGLANYQKAVQPFHQSGIYVRNNDPEFDKWVRISLEYQQKVWQPLEIYLYPHNIFLNFWSELGLAGMLLFIWLIGRFIFMNMKILFGSKIYEQKIFSVVLIATVVLIIVHGLVDVPYFKNDLAVMFWIIMAIGGVNYLEFHNSYYKK